MLQSLASLGKHRELASQYYEGQFSSLYAFASSGYVDQIGLTNEILECAKSSRGKEFIKLMDFYATVAESPTKEEVGEIYEFWHRTARDSRGMPVRCRANGRLKTWKTRPNDFRLPVKYGLKQCFYITEQNIGEWVPESPVR